MCKAGGVGVGGGGGFARRPLPPARPAVVYGCGQINRTEQIAPPLLGVVGGCVAGANVNAELAGHIGGGTRVGDYGGGRNNGVVHATGKLRHSLLHIVAINQVLLRDRDGESSRKHKRSDDEIVL